MATTTFAAMAAIEATKVMVKVAMAMTMGDCDGVEKARNNNNKIKRNVLCPLPYNCAMAAGSWTRKDRPWRPVHSF